MYLKDKQLVTLIQKGRYMCVCANGTDWLLGKLRGYGPWFTYTTQDWSNEEQRWVDIPKITHEWSKQDIIDSYNDRMVDHFVNCNT